MKKKHLHSAFSLAVASVLLASISCSIPSTKIKTSTLDSWLNEVDIQIPFSTETLDSSARFHEFTTVGSSLGTLVEESTLNVVIMKQLIEVVKDFYTGKEDVSETVFVLNREINDQDGDPFLWVYKVKAIYDENSFAVYLTYGFAPTQHDPADEYGPFWASLKLVAEYDGTFTTVVITDQASGGDEAQNYLGYNKSSGILVSKSEYDMDGDGFADGGYNVYTPSDRSFGYGVSCMVDVYTDTQTDFQIILIDADGVYLFEHDGTLSQVLFGATPADVSVVLDDPIPQVLQDTIDSWMTYDTETAAADLNVRSILLATDAPELSGLL